MPTRELVQQTIGRDRVGGVPQQERKQPALFRPAERQELVAVAHLERGRATLKSSRRRGRTYLVAAPLRTHCQRQSAAVDDQADAVGSVRRVMPGTTHTKRLSGRLAEVGPGLHEVTLRADGGVQMQSQLTFIGDHQFRGEGTVRFPDGRAVAFTFASLDKENHS